MSLFKDAFLSNTFDSNLFDYILNCSNILPGEVKYLVLVIDKLCMPMITIDDLFENRFCTALSLDLVTLTNYKTVEKLNGEISYDSIETKLDKDASEEHKNSIEGFDFVNYEHPSHLTLKTILEDVGLNVHYHKYCNYLNRLVFHIILYQDKLKNLNSYIKLVQTSQVDHLSSIYTKITQENINIATKYQLKPIKDPDVILEFLKFSLVKQDLQTEDIFQLFKHMNAGIELLDILLRLHGMDVDIQDKALGNSLLMVAARKGYLDWMLKLLEYGANVNIKSRVFGHTALTLAIQNNNLDCVLALIDIGQFPLSSKRVSHVTPLMFAVEYVDVLELLLSYDASTSFRDGNGKTALHMAVKIGRLESIYKLIECGADINALDGSGKSPLSWAANNGFGNIIKALLDMGADINHQEKDGYTPLMHCTINNRISCIQILLNYVDPALHDNVSTRNNNTVSNNINNYNIINIDIMNSSGKNALMIATEFGFYEIIDLLFAKGSNINLQNINGTTALMIAARNKDLIECVKRLIKNGAQIDLQDKYGYTALKYAEKENNKECISILKEER